MVSFSVQIPEEKCDPAIVATLFMESDGKVGFDLTWSGIRLKNENKRIVVEPRGSGEETLSGLYYRIFPRHVGTKTAVSGISYEKLVQEKDPGNRENGGYGAFEGGGRK